MTNSFQHSVQDDLFLIRAALGRPLLPAYDAALTRIQEQLQSAEEQRQFAVDRADVEMDRRRRMKEQNEALRDGYLELEADQHSWSERPCSTCRKISETLGRDFGCQRYAQIHEAHTIMLRTGDPKQYRAALAVSYPASSPSAEVGPWIPDVTSGQCGRTRGDGRELCGCAPGDLDTPCGQVVPDPAKNPDA